MIPALLLGTPNCTITAGISGSNIGYGDGTSGSPMPGTTFGAINFTPAFFLNAGRALQYVYTDGAQLEIGVDGALSDLTTATIVIGGETYTGSDYLNNSSGAGGYIYRWTQKAALVDGTEYTFSVT